MSQGFLRLLLIALALLVPATVVRAQSVLREADAKAAYLYNFLVFGDWPREPAPGGPLTLCVVGADSLDGALTRFARTPVRNREVKVDYFVTAADVRRCHLLFVPEAQTSQLNPLLRAAAGAPVLVVTDAEGGLARGAMIELRPADRRLVFAVRVNALRAAGVQLPASVMRLAAEVRE